jgi:F0F1-type ATP synthase assembly protein I
MDQNDERAPRRDEGERSARSGSPNGGAGAEPTRERAGQGNVGSLAIGGFEFAAVLLVFVFLGQWLDRRLETAPVFLLVCVFVGFAGATFSMYRRLTAAQQREDAERRAGKR